MSALVSIIMPAYNAAGFIKEAITSVLTQEYGNVELLVVNDGSTDNTLEVLKSINDDRLIVIDSVNQGVSSARNLALDRMSGDLFMFLDADDTLPSKSISKRAQILERNPSLAFVDGWLVRKSADMNEVLSVQKPDWRGNPLSELLKMSPRVFSGLTWMVRRDHEHAYAFKAGMTHAEDLLFFMSIAHHGDYAVLPEPVLNYRQVESSAMRNIKGLESGYRILLNSVESEVKEKIEKEQLDSLRAHLKSVIVKSYLKKGLFTEAIRSYFSFD